MNDNRIDVSCVVIYACGAIAREAPRASDGTHTQETLSLYLYAYIPYVEQEDTAAELMDLLLPSPKPLAAARCKTQINKHTLAKLLLHFEGQKP